MAKGGINLTPRADATLVNQAARMGMAGVPKDLSKTFKGMSDSYASAMSTIGEVGNAIGQTLGKLAGEGIKIATENLKNRQAGTYDDFTDGGLDETARTLLEDLKEKGRFLKDTDGDGKKEITDRFKFGKEGKQARQEFRKEKKQTLALLEDIRNKQYGNLEAASRGEIIEGASSATQLTMNNAIAAGAEGLGTNTSFPGVKAVSYITEVDGKKSIAYRLQDKDGNLIKSINEVTNQIELAAGEDDAYSVAANKIDKLITKKDALVVENFSKIGANSYNSGLKNQEFQVNKTKSDILTSVKTDDAFSTAVHSNELGLDQSYADMLSSSNSITEEMYTSLFDLNKDGTIDASEQAKADSNVRRLGFDNKEEFMSVDNMLALKKAMLDPTNIAARNIFANWATGEMADQHILGGQDYTKTLNVETAAEKRQRLKDEKRSSTIDALKIGQKIIEYDNTRVLFSENGVDYALLTKNELSDVDKNGLSAIDNAQFFNRGNFIVSLGGEVLPGEFDDDNSVNEKEEEEFNAKLGALGNKVNADGNGEIYVNQKFDGGFRSQAGYEGYLFESNSEKFIAGTLNREYKSLGFRFEMKGANRITAFGEDKDGKEIFETFKTNQGDALNKNEELRLKQWMQDNKPALK